MPKCILSTQKCGKEYYFATTGDLFFFLPTIAFDKAEKDLSLAWLNWQIGVMVI